MVRHHSLVVHRWHRLDSILWWLLTVVLLRMRHLAWMVWWVHARLELVRWSSLSSSFIIDCLYCVRLLRINLNFLPLLELLIFALIRCYRLSSIWVTISDLFAWLLFLLFTFIWRLLLLIFSWLPIHILLRELFDSWVVFSSLRSTRLPSMLLLRCIWSLLIWRQVRIIRLLWRSVPWNTRQSLRRSSLVIICTGGLLSLQVWRRRHSPLLLLAVWIRSTVGRMHWWRYAVHVLRCAWWSCKSWLLAWWSVLMLLHAVAWNRIAIIIEGRRRWDSTRHVSLRRTIRAASSLIPTIVLILWWCTWIAWLRWWTLEPCRWWLVFIQVVSWCSSLSRIIQLNRPCKNVLSLKLSDSCLSLFLDSESKEAEPFWVFGYRVHYDLGFVYWGELLREHCHQALVVHVRVKIADVHLKVALGLSLSCALTKTPHLCTCGTTVIALTVHAAWGCTLHAWSWYRTWGCAWSRWTSWSTWMMFTRTMWCPVQLEASLVAWYCRPIEADEYVLCYFVIGELDKAIAYWRSFQFVSD